VTAAEIPLPAENLKRGNKLLQAGRFEEALAAFAAAGNQALALRGAGIALRRLGRFAEAGASFDKALALNPDDADTRYYRGMMRLLRGDFAKGWADAEARPALRQLRAGLTGRATWWRGEALAGHRLLLLSEQGFGDVMQFLRFLPGLAAQAEAVVLDCHPKLARLMRASFPEAEIAPRGAAIPGHDCAAALLSLPHLLNLHSANDLSVDAPYLQPPPERLAFWQERLAALPGPLIGLAWSGRSTHPDQSIRSLALASLRPLMQASGSFVSLQVEAPRAAEIAVNGLQARITDLSDELTDFAESAAVVANLDLVISVDSAVCHLAGALGRPVWTLLPAVPDWRWGLEGKTSYWYPRMRLYRQSVIGAWAPLVAKVAEDLQEEF